MSQYCPRCFFQNEDGIERCTRCNGELHVQNLINQLPVMIILNRRYLVGKVLGAGGFGITYAGYDQLLKKRVAIKEYFPNGFVMRADTRTCSVETVSDEAKTMLEKGKEQFLEEARTMSRFSQLHTVVDVLDFFELNGTAYIVMEYLDGVSMGQHLKQHGPEKNFDRLYAMLQPVMKDLAEIHWEGVIHRDISPSNLMLLKNGTVKLLDFGTAREICEDGGKNLTVILKHGYAPPEQYSQKGQQGAWTDIYALCATIYKLLTNERPDAATDRQNVDTLQPPSRKGVAISPAQEQTLLRGLALKRSERIQTLDELMEGFEKQTIIDMPPTPSPSSPDFRLPTRETTISAGGCLPVALRTDGAVVTLDYESVSQREVDGMTDIIAIAASYHTVGLHADGTVVAVGDNEHGQCNVSDWKNVVSISAGFSHTVGLLANGTAVAVGDNEHGQCNVSDWKNVVSISAGFSHTVGLRADGTVVAVGDKRSGECDVSGWTDIAAISAGFSHTVGLRTDGTVVAAGYGYDRACDVADWKDIVAVSAGRNYTLGLRSDGTVAVTGENQFGACDVSDWKNLLAVSGGFSYSMGLRADGTVVVTKQTGEYAIGRDVSGWRSIRLPEY